MKKLVNYSRHEGYNNEGRSFKTVLVLDSPLQGRCLQQIGPSCQNNLKLFVSTLATFVSLLDILSQKCAFLDVMSQSELTTHHAITLNPRNTIFWGRPKKVWN